LLAPRALSNQVEKSVAARTWPRDQGRVALKRYFTREYLVKLREKFETIGPKTDRLLLRFVAHQFADPKAREYAHHGFARRIQTLTRCIHNTFKIVPPAR
jgi:hypothetical protein